MTEREWGPWRSLRQRASGPEWIDSPTFSRQAVLDTFRFLEPVNRWFGGHRPYITFFQRESRAWDRAATCRLLDVGCGAGDVAVALARWARRRGYRLQIHGMDHHPAVVELARERCRLYPEISLACRDLFDPDDGEYDYVLASQFLHHFADAELPAVLARLLALARRKAVINDLLRVPLAYAATWLFTTLTSAVFRHDARLSVRRGFVLHDLEALLHAAGYRRFRLEKHFFYRFILILDKGEYPLGM